jgi:hypothetical protein
MPSAARVRLQWRMRRSFDRCFSAERRTWASTTDGYQISQCELPDFTLVFPAWAKRRPEYFRSLKAAMKAAEEHRNHDD